MAGGESHARTGRALLALCGHRAGEASGLSQAEWHTLDALAHEHRLRPFLQGRLDRGEIAGVPAPIAETWLLAHRSNAIEMLAQRRALAQAKDILASKAIGCVALKGVALGWTVWPSPAERQMRDIDLLVAQENAGKAYRALRAAGWDAPEIDEASLARFAEHETHLPPLVSEEGVQLELHARAWGRPPLPGSPMPRNDAKGLLGRARHSEALQAAIPSPEDMLSHLVVHAACSHLLNVGPMALIDVDLWCRRKPIDWPAFWERGARDGFDRPAALVFSLVERWRDPGFCAAAEPPLAVEPQMLDEAELLLVQDLNARKDVSVIASLTSRRVGGRIEQHPLDRAATPNSLVARTAQLASRAVSLARNIASPQVRRDGIATARLQRWLEG